MKITVTFRNCRTGREYDIQIDHKQKINTTLLVLKENLPEVLDGIEGDLVLQSERNKRRLDLEQSYESAKIYNCDILLISQA